MPKVPRLLLLIVAIGLASFFTYQYEVSGTSAAIGRENAWASIDLERPFIIYLKAEDGNPNAEKPELIERLKEYSQLYKSIVEMALDGEILHQYDTVLHGFSVVFDYTEKIMKVAGSPDLGENVKADTLDRLQKFLFAMNEDEFKKLGIELHVEYDEEVSTQ